MALLAMLPRCKNLWCFFFISLARARVSVIVERSLGSLVFVALLDLYSLVRFYT